MKRPYITPPALEKIRLNAPALMLNVSRSDSHTDDEDSDKSRSFWGSTLFDEDTEDASD